MCGDTGATEESEPDLELTYSDGDLALILLAFLPLSPACAEAQLCTRGTEKWSDDGHQKWKEERSRSVYFFPSTYLPSPIIFIFLFLLLPYLFPFASYSFHPLSVLLHYVTPSPLSVFQHVFTPLFFFRLFRLLRLFHADPSCESKTSSVHFGSIKLL